ncbi:hypothetical protein [Enterococcus gilvus]|uniref:hypothetical protein n=1 Tax=Enterococcus gilvus TaxID=160453 RepID=UPI00345E0881
MENFLIENKKDDFFEQFGYEAIGPILFGFSTYLAKELEKNRNLNLFFLSRDGKIMERAMKIVSPNYLERFNYLYGSRRAIIVPSLYDCESIEEILIKFKLRKYESVQSILKRFGIEKDKQIFVDIEAKYSIDSRQEVDSRMFKRDTVYRKIIEDHIFEIKNNALEEKKIYRTYLKKMNFTGDIGLVDIGWYGNMQNALESINIDLKSTNIYGYYLGNMNDNTKSNMYGYLFDADKNQKIRENIQLIIGLFELFFTANHGSVIKIILDNNDFVPLFDKYEYENNNDWEKINSVQNGALQFISDFQSSKISTTINLSVDNLTSPLFKRVLTPKLKDTQLFGDLSFFDNGHRYIAKHEKRQSYFREFKNCPWRIGFLKRYLKIPLPYRFIELVIRKKLKKSGG